MGTGGNKERDGTMERTPEEKLTQGLVAVEYRNIRDITMSRAVSHASLGLRPRTGGLDILVRLRRTMSNRARAKANAREEGGAAMRCESRHGAGAAYDAGFIAQIPVKPDLDDYIRRALAAGFEDDADAQTVRALCEAWPTTAKTMTQTQSKHTPGPWESQTIYPQTGGMQYRLRGGDGYSVLNIRGGTIPVDASAPR